jgi:4-amino-4-deoxy-L-arabinose transferase-like glycosyltransferase
MAASLSRARSVGSRIRRDPFRRALRAFRSPIGGVAVIALLHGLAWTVLTPAYQTPDEPAHFAYVQQLAETGHLPPREHHADYSSEEYASFAALNTLSIIGRPLRRPPNTRSSADRAMVALDRARSLSRKDGGGVSSASSQPPLFYALGVIPYELGHGATIVTRLWLVRLVSLLCFVGTAVAAAAFVREVVPGRSWAPTLAGLLIALQPMLAFASTGVNPDSLLFFLATVTLLLIARCLRRGVTRRRAVVFGLVIGAGVVTKFTYAALLPAAVLAVAIALVREARDARRRPAVTKGLLAAGVAVSPVLLYAFVSWAQGRSISPPSTSASSAAQVASTSLRGFLSYAWQLFLPRPWFLTDQFGYWPPYHTWLTGLVGFFGWLDYGLAGWTYIVAAVVFCGSLALVIVTMAQRSRLWRYRIEIAIYTIAAVALGIVVARTSYDFKASGLPFEQARYLFPLVGLYVLGIVTACMAFGRRWAPVAAAVYVNLAILHVVAAVFATVARYYG